jgi:hypothetical protein
MYFALQYHVVRSDTGIRILPRTPQHSLALAWADVRTWTPSQWTDRLELARAAMAAGASDLIADSVRLPLQDEVSESAATLNELRDFLNRSRQQAQGAVSQFAEARRPELPEVIPDSQRPLTATPAQAEATSELDHEDNSEDQLAASAVPVPPPADPFRPGVGIAANSPAPAASATSPTQSSRFSNADVRAGMKPTIGSPGISRRTPPPSDAAAALLKDAEDIERRIFGDVSGQPDSTIQPGSAGFNRAAAELEKSARDLLNQVEQVATGRGAGAAENNPDSAENDKPFVRNPEGSPTTSAAAPPSPTEDNSGFDVFDPFLEADAQGSP